MQPYAPQQRVPPRRGRSGAHGSALGRAWQVNAHRSLQPLPSDVPSPGVARPAAWQAAWERWLKHFEAVVHICPEPTVLVTRCVIAPPPCPQGEPGRQRMPPPHPQLKERVRYANSRWLKLCERQAEDVVGKAFSEIDGFQGPLTSEASKLQLASLLVTEKAVVDGIQVVNYVGTPGRPIALELRVHIFRCHGENLAFISQVTSHQEVLDTTRIPSVCFNAVAGSGRAAAAALAAIGVPATCEPGDIPFMWRHLVNRCSKSTAELRDDDTEQGDHTCTICLCVCSHGEPSRVLACGHRFHERCIDGWFASLLTRRSNQDSLFQPLFLDKRDGCSPLSCPTCKQDPLTPTSCTIAASGCEHVVISQCRLAHPAGRLPETTVWECR